MLSKKSKKADVDRRKGLYFLLGLTMALAAWYGVLTYDANAESNGRTLSVVHIPDGIEEELPATQDPAQPPEPPTPEPEQPDYTPVDEIDPEIEIELPDEVEFTSDVFKTEFNDPEIDEEEQPFDIVEQMPNFPGGQDALINFLQTETKYPAVARDMGIEEKIYVQFVVRKDGRITDVKVVRGGDKYLREEALRVVERMPDWEPGRQRGRAVPVRFVLPINFRLK